MVKLFCCLKYWYYQRILLLATDQIRKRYHVMIFDITIWYFIVNNTIFILDDKQLYAHYVKSSCQEVLWKKGTKNLKIAIPFLSNVDRSYEKKGKVNFFCKNKKNEKLLRRHFSMILSTIKCTSNFIIHLSGRFPVFFKFAIFQQEFYYRFPVFTYHFQ